MPRRLFVSLVLALLAAFATTSAQGQDAPAVPDGYATPAEAARAFLAGLRNEEALPQMRRAVPPAEREAFDSHGRRTLRAITVEELTIGETQPQEGNRRAFCLYEWRVTIDEEAMIAAALEDARAHLREEGLSADELEAAMRQHAPQIRTITQGMVRSMRRPQQRMILVAIDGRWYVENLTDPSYRPE